LIASFLQKATQGGIFCRLAGLSLLFAACLFISLPATAKHNGATLKVDQGLFKVTGSIAKNSCSAQANFKSNSAKPVGFSIYWRPSESMHLLVAHPMVATTSGRQKLRFVFPDGTDLTFSTTAHGKILQMPLGLANNVPALFHAVKTNPNVQIEILGINDTILLELRDHKAVLDAMEDCRQWLI
jgi:hypothetical protein